MTAFDDIELLAYCGEMQMHCRDTAERNEHDSDFQTQWRECLSELTRRGFNLGDL